MKKLTITLLLTLTSSSVFADYLMDKYDLDSDKMVTVAELEQAGCSIKRSLFNTADKNKDGVLSKKEIRRAKHYLVTRKRCPGKSNA
jgi:hypothetical protein